MRIPLNCTETDIFKPIYANTVINEKSSEHIIPDTNPDISKVLNVQSQLIVTSKKATQDQIIITAEIEISIIYKNEDDEGITCVGKVLPIEITEAVDGASEATAISVVCSVKSVSATMLNSRKLLLKADTCFDITCRNPEIMNVCYDVIDSSDCNIELLQNKAEICPVVEIIEKSVSVSDEYKLPTERGVNSRLVSANTQICTTEVKPVAGKLVYKATAETTAVFMSSDNTETFTCNFVTPFSQIIEISRDSPNIASCAVSALTGVEFVPLTNREDGSFSARFQINIQMICAEKMEIAYVLDAYSNNYNTELTCEKHSIEKMTVCDEIHIQLSGHSEAENVSSLYVSSGDTSIMGDTFNANVNLCGISKSDEEVYNPVKVTANGEHKIAIEDGQEVCITNVSYAMPNITAAGDITVDMKVNYRIYDIEKFEAVTEIVCYEDEKLDKSVFPSLTVLCAENDMSIWQLAKKYHSTPKLIEYANSEYGEFSIEARPLLIPKA